MGTLAAYSLVAGTYLLAAYIIYKWLLSGENQPTFNRVILLSLYAVALTLPFAPELSMPAKATIPTKVTTLVTSVLEIGTTEIAMTEGTAVQWQSIAVSIYIVGVILTAFASLISFFRLMTIIRKGRKIVSDDYTIIILPTTDLAPFSWLRYIVMSESDYREAGDMIVCHENSHLHLLHWIDLLLAQIVVIVLWYNPSSWMMRSELRSVHEYQADSWVLRSGVDACKYQLLLIKKAVGRRFPSLANSLNHSKLKKRITMMCNPKTGKTRRMRALAVVPAFAAALVLTNIPSIASTVSEVADTPLVESVSKDTKKNVAIQDSLPTPEVSPEYPDGEYALYNFINMNTIYPSEAVKKGEQGRVVIRFIVEPDGSITNCQVVKSISPLLDAEAIRVVYKMPKWKPGTSGGKAVRCSYALPFVFKLQ